ncbi:MAG: MFS transporter [Chloroflexota bacterium]
MAQALDYVEAPPVRSRLPEGSRGANDRYKWVVLSNTTLGILMAAMNSSILLISLPAIFRGIQINPLAPGQSSFLLWILLGYMIVTATLVVTFGRISDMVGRVKMYTLGFAIFTLASILLSLTPGTGTQGGLELLIFRLVQGVGGAFLFANSAALLTDAFLARQRGLAMGVNQIAGIAGALGGLLVGGVLATIQWRLVFWVSVLFGVFGTIWAYLKLHETATIRRGQQIDYLGNATFAIGLTVLLVGLTYGIEPYGTSSMGWGNPFVIASLIIGIVFFLAFVLVEMRVKDPLFHLELFNIRMFAAGNLSNFLGSLARGGLQFMLVIWLQGIWLPLHGYSYADTPLWAGIYMMPMMAGFMVAGPLSGILSDRFGARRFTSGGMLVTTVGFILLTMLPGDFNKWLFFALLIFLGVGMGLFSAPNTSSVMSSVPPEMRGAASGMLATFQNAGMMMSMAVFFSILTGGLAARLPAVMEHGLVANGLPMPVAQSIAHLPPIGVLFAAFLGYNPMQSLVPADVAQHLSAAAQATLFGKTFFPTLILPAFMDGLKLAFYVSAGMSLIATIASVLRGKVVFYGQTASRDVTTGQGQDSERGGR